MRLWRSAHNGQRALNLRDWVAVSVLTWLTPIPLGLLLIAVARVSIFGASVLGGTSPSVVATVYATGLIVVYIPFLSWIGLIPALPIVWLALRLGLGGWGSFALGGMGIGWFLAGIPDGVPPYPLMAAGMFHALIWRWMMGRFRPAAFEPVPIGPKFSN